MILHNMKGGCPKAVNQGILRCFGGRSETHCFGEVVQIDGIEGKEVIASEPSDSPHVGMRLCIVQAICKRVSSFSKFSV